MSGVLGLILDRQWDFLQRVTGLIKLDQSAGPVLDTLPPELLRETLGYLNPAALSALCRADRRVAAIVQADRALSREVTQARGVEREWNDSPQEWTAEHWWALGSGAIGAALVAAGAAQGASLIGTGMEMAQLMVGGASGLGLSAFLARAGTDKTEPTRTQRVLALALNARYLPDQQRSELVRNIVAIRSPALRIDVIDDVVDQAASFTEDDRIALLNAALNSSDEDNRSKGIVVVSKAMVHWNDEQRERIVSGALAQTGAAKARSVAALGPVLQHLSTDPVNADQRREAILRSLPDFEEPDRSLVIAGLGHGFHALSKEQVARVMQAFAAIAEPELRRQMIAGIAYGSDHIDSNVRATLVTETLNDPDDDWRCEAIRGFLSTPDSLSEEQRDQMLTAGLGLSPEHSDRIVRKASERLDIYSPEWQDQIINKARALVDTPRNPADAGVLGGRKVETYESLFALVEQVGKLKGAQQSRLVDGILEIRDMRQRKRAISSLAGRLSKVQDGGVRFRLLRRGVPNLPQEADRVTTLIAFSYSLRHLDRKAQMHLVGQALAITNMETKTYLVSAISRIGGEALHAAARARLQDAEAQFPHVATGH
jgi:hypothetical protein